MTKAALEVLSIKQLIERFAEIGVAQDEALLYDESKKYNRLFKAMEAVNAELRHRSAQLELLNLYGHPNVQVQLQAARYTAKVAPVAARDKVEAIASSKDFPQAGHAGMTLWSWDTYGVSDR